MSVHRWLWLCLLVVLLYLLLGHFAQGQTPEAVVAQVNRANAQIQSMSADTRLVVRRRILTFTLVGQFAYEKDKNFRMINQDSKTLEKMSDFGSNDTLFWVYAQRIDPNEIFYCKHSELAKSRMQPSLEPLTLMEALGVQTIDLATAIQVTSEGGYVRVIQDQRDPRGFTLRRLTVIDPTKLAIIQRSLFAASSQKLLADCRITAMYQWERGYVPKSLTIQYPLETAHITWELSNVRVNPGLPDDIWTMPVMPVRAVDLATGVREKGLTY